MDASRPAPLVRLKVGVAEERAQVMRDLFRCEEALARIRTSERRREIAARHPLLFGKVYFPDLFEAETPSFHWEIVDGYLNFSRFGVAAPVGSAKTTILTKLSSMWSVFFERMRGRHLEEVLVISSSGELAGIWLKDMGNRLRANDELREDFGVFEGGSWGAGEMEFSLKDAVTGKPRTSYLRAIGRLSATRGRRPDRIILDDPEDEESVKSAKQREDFRVWFWGAVVNRLNTPWRKLTYIGTCMDEEAFLVDLLHRPPPGWHVRSYQMLDETTGESLWPGQYPKEFLMQRRSEIGEERFQAEFQNRPVKLWYQKIFDVTRVGVEAWKIQGDDFVVVTLDPAFREGADEWAVTMVACDRKGTWHEIESESLSTGVEGWEEYLEHLRRKYPRINVCGIESGGPQVAVEYVVKTWMLRTGISLPVRFIHRSKNTQSKTERISRLTSVINTGRLTVQPGHRKVYEAIRDYRAGLERQNDHMMDAMAMQLEVQAARLPSELVAPTADEIRHQSFQVLQKRISAGKRMLQSYRPASDILEKYA